MPAQHMADVTLHHVNVHVLMVIWVLIVNKRFVLMIVLGQTRPQISMKHTMSRNAPIWVFVIVKPDYVNVVKDLKERRVKDNRV